MSNTQYATQHVANVRNRVNRPELDRGNVDKSRTPESRDGLDPGRSLSGPANSRGFDRTPSSAASLGSCWSLVIEIYYSYVEDGRCGHAVRSRRAGANRGGSNRRPSGVSGHFMSQPIHFGIFPSLRHLQPSNLEAPLPLFSSISKASSLEPMIKRDRDVP
jgi:hypothetical protein